MVNLTSVRWYVDKHTTFQNSECSQPHPPKNQMPLKRGTFVLVKKKIAVDQTRTYDFKFFNGLLPDGVCHTPSTRRAFSSSRTHQRMVSSVTERVESAEISDENTLLPELELAQTSSCYGKMPTDVLEPLLHWLNNPGNLIRRAILLRGVSNPFKETVDRIYRCLPVLFRVSLFFWRNRLNGDTQCHTQTKTSFCYFI